MVSLKIPFIILGGDFIKISRNELDFMGKDILQIVHNYFKGESSRDDLETAISLFEEPYNNLELRPTLYEIWNNDELIDRNSLLSGNSEGNLDKIHHKIHLDEGANRTKSKKNFIIYFSKFAAVLIIGLFLGYMLNLLKIDAPVYYTSIAPKGSVSQVLLPDQTMVYLNAGSEIKYSANGIDGRREVFLEGEAWFQVVRNEKKPFVVHTPFYDVNVLGTKFNVKAYKTDEEIVTTLEEGSVQISSSKNIIDPSNNILKPGEQLAYNQFTNVFEIREVNTRIYTSWKYNQLIFVNMSLKELIILMERKYGVDIEVSDNAILDFHYDGAIKDETILEMLDLIKETLPVQYKIEGQTILIIKK